MFDYLRSSDCIRTLMVSKRAMLIWIYSQIKIFRLRANLFLSKNLSVNVKIARETILFTVKIFYMRPTLLYLSHPY